MFTFFNRKKNRKFIENKINEIHGTSSIDIVADYLKMIHDNSAEYFDYLDSKYPISKKELKSFQDIEINLV